MDLNRNAESGRFDGANAGGTDNGSVLSLDDAIRMASEQITQPKDNTPHAGPVAKGEDVGGNGEARPATQAAGAVQAPVGETRAEETGQPVILTAPKHWPQDRQALFNGASEDIKRAWLAQSKDAEGGLTRKSQELAEVKRFADDIRSVFTAEHRAQMQAEGIANEGEAIRYLLGMHDFFTRDPVGYVRTVMQHAGIRPEMLFQAPQGGQQAAPAPQVDPHVAALMNKIAGLERAFVSRETQARAQAEQTAASLVNEFAAKTGQDGSLLHPHFDRVESDMIDILTRHPQIASMPMGLEKLKAAYDEAVWRNPEVRAEVVAAREAEWRKQAAPIQQAQRARSAASVIPSPGSNASGAPQAGGLMDIIKESARQLGI